MVVFFCTTLFYRRQFRELGYSLESRQNGLVCLLWREDHRFTTALVFPQQVEDQHKKVSKHVILVFFIAASPITYKYTYIELWDSDLHSKAQTDMDLCGSGQIKPFFK